MNTKKTLFVGIGITILVVAFFGFKDSPLFGGSLDAQIGVAKEIVIDSGVQGEVEAETKYDITGKPETEKIASCQSAYTEYQVLLTASLSDFSNLPSYIVVDTEKLLASIQGIKTFINANCNI